MNNEKQLVAATALNAWDLYFKRADKFFGDLTDEQLMKEIAPGRNRGIYLLGHLIAVHDNILPTMGLGERKHPGLDDAFIKNPDKSGREMPSIGELRKQWADVHQELSDKFSRMSPDEWFQKHNSVSDEDFAKEPHRNRLGLLMNRTNHMAYHFGQVALTAK